VENALAGAAQMIKRKLQLLAVDTATESCGAAVICGNSILSEMIVGSGRSHSREILKLIQYSLFLVLGVLKE